MARARFIPPILAACALSANAQVIAIETGSHVGSDVAADDHFGYSVGFAQNYAIVGAPGNDDLAEDAGAAYIICVNSVNQFELQKLLPPEPVAGGRFGASVALVGNATYEGFIAVVGAPGANSGPAANAGKVYVYRFDGGSWTFEQEIPSLLPETGAEFGASVSLWTNLAGVLYALEPGILVGAPGEDGPGAIADAGAAYVYSYQYDIMSGEGAWVPRARLIPFEQNPGDRFGASVAISHSTHETFRASRALVGAPGDDTIAPDAGAAYTFEYDSDIGVWTPFETEKLTGSGTVAGSRFGAAVALDRSPAAPPWSSEAALVGAPADLTPGTGTGSVYVFLPDPPPDPSGIPTSWNEIDELTPLGAMIDDRVGAAVSFETDPLTQIGYAVLGAPGTDAIAIDDGAAHIYRDTGAGWTEEAIVINSNGADGDQMGAAVAQSETRAVLGACYVDAEVETIIPDTGRMLWVGGLADCDTNATLDLVDITMGAADDSNANGVPDSCQFPCTRADITTQGAGACSADYFMPDGVHTAADLNLYVNLWFDALWLGDGYYADYTSQGAPIGDPLFGVPDGIVSAADLLYFLNIWLGGCP